MTSDFTGGEVHQGALPDVPAEVWERVLAHVFDPASVPMADVVPDDDPTADIADAWSDPTPDHYAAAVGDDDPSDVEDANPLDADAHHAWDASWAPTSTEPEPDLPPVIESADAHDDGDVAW